MQCFSLIIMENYLKYNKLFLGWKQLMYVLKYIVLGRRDTIRLLIVLYNMT